MIRRKTTHSLIKAFLIAILASMILSSYTSSIRLAIGKSMDGIYIVAFIADGFDYSELTSIKGYLEKWGCNVSVAGLSNVVQSDSGRSYTSDLLISDVEITQFNCVLIPGGKSPYKLVKEQIVLNLVKSAYEQGLILAAICHGPLVLAKAGVINGTRVTGHIEIKLDLVEAGGIYVDAKVIRDDNIITGNWPHFREFSICIAQAFGCYEENPPVFLEIQLTPTRGNPQTNFTLKVKVYDESGVSVIAMIYNETAEGERCLVLTLSLERVSNDLIFAVNFTLRKPGKYIIDVKANDIYDNYNLTKNAVTFFVEEETFLGTYAYILGGSAIIIILLVLVIFVKKRTR